MSDKIDDRSRRQFLRVCCEEPFRIFFPAGALLGVFGVSLWPLFYFGAGIAYPNIAHARLMIEGFMASFIFGFLGTAGPRITSAPHFSLAELGPIFTLDFARGGTPHRWLGPHRCVGSRATLKSWSSALLRRSDRIASSGSVVQEKV